MKIINEFKEFALRGNMIEMAVGIVIGASFNSVVDSLVKKYFIATTVNVISRHKFSRKKINSKKSN